MASTQLNYVETADKCMRQIYGLANTKQGLPLHNHLLIAFVSYIS